MIGQCPLKMGRKHRYDLKIKLESFRSEIQDGGYLENLFLASSPELKDQ